MSEVRVRENEPLDRALRRFKRECAKDGILTEIKRHEYYEKPSERKKRKQKAARKRQNRRRETEE